MKKILIVTHDLEIGGAQKGLVNFLGCFDSAGLENEYDIHLLVFKPNGPLYSSIPDSVKLIAPSPILQWFACHLHPQLLWKCFSLRGIAGELYWLIRSRFQLFSKPISKSQKMWECWKKFIPNHTEEYDVAVSYIDGGTSYFVMDKVQAKKKVLWVHSEYQKRGYVPAYDKPFYDACDGIITISDQCRQCILHEFPDLLEKVHVLQNISSYDTVIQKSCAELPTEFPDAGVLKILSVGRLHEQKGFDLAIEAAALLKKENVPFVWLVVGEGSERYKLQKMIDEHGVSDCFFLVGARENPYVYMKACTILVQSSRVEGKSIVLDEVKMLNKPVVVTNYVTVKDSIEHGVNGWIVDMTPEAIAEGIVKLWGNPELQKQLSENLQQSQKGNVEELNKYIKIMLE